jgi:hypothetical protein
MSSPRFFLLKVEVQEAYPNGFIFGMQARWKDFQGLPSIQMELRKQVAKCLSSQQSSLNAQCNSMPLYVVLIFFHRYITFLYFHYPGPRGSCP